LPKAIFSCILENEIRNIGFKGLTKKEVTT